MWAYLIDKFANAVGGLLEAFFGLIFEVVARLILDPLFKTIEKKTGYIPQPSKPLYLKPTTEVKRRKFKGARIDPRTPAEHLPADYIHNGLTQFEEWENEIASIPDPATPRYLRSQIRRFEPSEETVSRARARKGRPRFRYLPDFDLAA